ncbi:MAG: NYN domain-containing protein [Patescibacteria group bacterium]
MKKPEKTVYAFIDSQNLNLGVRDQGWKLDFAKLRVYLKDKYKVEKALLFIGFVAGNEVLYKHLQESGYVLIIKPTLSAYVNGKAVVKGNVDAELVLHSMIEYPNYDKAIIISGDGDFRCLVEYLKGKEKLGRLLIPNRRKYSRLLGEFREEMDFIEQNLKNKLERL